MGAVWLRARAELRRRWGSSLVLVLLVGLAGGTVMGTAAGARRTASAYPRLLDAAAQHDVLVNPDSGALDFDAIANLPGVVDEARGYGQFVATPSADGQPDFSIGMVPLASDGRLGYEITRPVRVDGRLPDRDRPDEVFLDRGLAEDLGVDAGDDLEMLAFSGEESPPEMVTFRVTGTGVFAENALRNEGAEADFPILMLTPAWRTAHPQPPPFVGSAVELAPGEDVLERFLADAQEVVEGQVFIQVQAETTAKAERALRPYWGALAVFSVVTALAAALVVGQALARQVSLDGVDRPVLAALGMSGRQLLALDLARAGVVAIAGTALALALAAGLSPLMPIGPAHDFDPAPGFHADWTVLAVGGAGLLVAIVAWSALVGWWGRRQRRPGQAERARASGLGEALAGAGAPAPATVGLRMALEAGRGATAAPVRTTLVGAALGLAALVAAVTFGAGLDHFVATPRLYGWDWDAAVVTSEDPNADRAAIEAARGVQGVTAGNHGQVAIDGVSVASVALGSPRGQPPSVHPPVLEGRMATRPGEVVLGTTTLRRTGRSVGDQVTMSVADRSATATVVGRATFPRFAAYPGADKTGLGDGAILTLDDLEELIPGATTSFFLVRTGDVDALEAAVDTDDLESSAIVLRTPQRPDAIAGFERVNRTPLVLAGLLTVLAGAATAHGLVTTVRRRRRTFAVLKAMGFTRRQISSTVAWSSTTVAVVALLVGLPLGVAAGRSAWVVLADRMGAPAEPVTPVLVLLVAVPVVLLVANLVAWFPGRSAARIRPAVALRSE